MLSTLFDNLQKFSSSKDVNFSEKMLQDTSALIDAENQLFFTCFTGLLDFSDTTDFAAKISQKDKPKCSKGYPCGNGCIAVGYNCKKAIEGQAKTYAGWLELQAKKKSKIAIDKSNKSGDTGNKATKTEETEETEMKAQFKPNQELENATAAYFDKNRQKKGLPLTMAMSTERQYQGSVLQSPGSIESTANTEKALVDKYREIYDSRSKGTLPYANSVPVFVSPPVVDGKLIVDSDAISKVAANNTMFAAIKDQGIPVQVIYLKGTKQESDQLNAFFNGNPLDDVKSDPQVYEAITKSRLFSSNLQPTTFTALTREISLSNDSNLNPDLVNQYRKIFKDMSGDDDNDRSYGNLLRQRKNLIPIIVKPKLDAKGKIDEEAYEVVANKEVYAAARLENFTEVQISFFNGSKDQADEINLFFKNKSKN